MITALVVSSERSLDLHHEDVPQSPGLSEVEADAPTSSTSAKPSFPPTKKGSGRRSRRNDGL